MGTFSEKLQSEDVNPEIQNYELAREAAGGSKRAFEKIVGTYEDMVYRLAFRFFGNEEDSLDAVQEVFVKAYRAIGSFEGRSSLKTWLYRIASNTCLTLAEEKKRRKKSFLQSIVDWFSQTPVADPAKTVIHREYQMALQQAIADKIAKIPEFYRLPVILKDLEGKTLEEIADILEIKEGTVKSRINRGRKMLQEALEPFFKERAES